MGLNDGYVLPLIDLQHQAKCGVPSLAVSVARNVLPLVALPLG